MDHRVKVSFGSAVLVLTLGAVGGLVASVIVAARAYRSQWETKARDDRTIQVTGSARMRIRSDLAVWTIRVRGDAPELTAAYAQLKAGVDRVRNFLAQRSFESVAQEAVETDTHNVRDKDGHTTPEVSGYTLTQDLVVTSANVEAVAEAAGRVTDLIQEGVQVISRRPEFTFTKIADLKIQMIGEASKDARARADEIAQNAGCCVSDVRTARMGVFQITRPDSTDVSDSGIHDTATIEKDVRSVVTLTLGIQAR